MTIDHDAIAARVRQDREKGSPGPWHQAEDNPSHIDYTDQFVTCWNVAYVHTHCGHPIDGSSSNARRIAALPDLEAAYLDLYDEVKRLRAERDRFEAALGRACQVGGTTYLVERAEKAEAERDRLLAARAAERAAWAARAAARAAAWAAEKETYLDLIAIARAALKGDNNE